MSSSVNKITLRSQVGRGAKYSFQKVPFIIKTILKLALVNGYDDQGRIRNEKGEFIPNSNLLDLMSHAMSVGKNLYATNEFVSLLAEAQVDPEWIINDHVRTQLSSKLLNRSSGEPESIYRSEPQKESAPAPVTPPAVRNPITMNAYWSPKKAAEKKRTLAAIKRPPPLKMRPITTTPPSSPPSPFLKDQPPLIDRMDVAPASPLSEMPVLERVTTKRGRETDDDESEPEQQTKRSRTELQDAVNKSLNWELPDDDDEW